MQPNNSNTCLQCLKSKIDITEELEKSINIHHCKMCNRFKRPPWEILELESPALLSHCLKQIKGLTKKFRLVDAGFIWTEPHSRRLKVKLTVQKEVMGNTMLQKEVVIEFVIHNL